MEQGTGRVTDAQIEAYEGLVCSTTEIQLGTGTVNVEREDLRQLFRIKVWDALRTYDPVRCRTSERSYVFSCVFNFAKDLHRGTKYRPRPEDYIEDLLVTRRGGDEFSGRDRWEARHGLVEDRDTIFSGVETEEVPIPNTLSEVEVHVVCLLYSDYRQTEIAQRLGLTKRQMESAMRSVREKLIDFKPGDGATVVALPVRRDPEAVAA